MNGGRLVQNLRVEVEGNATVETAAQVPTGRSIPVSHSSGLDTGVVGEGRASGSAPIPSRRSPREAVAVAALAVVLSLVALLVAVAAGRSADRRIAVLEARLRALPAAAAQGGDLARLGGMVAGPEGALVGGVLDALAKSGEPRQRYTCKYCGIPIVGPDDPRPLGRGPRGIQPHKSDCPRFGR